MNGKKLCDAGVGDDGSLAAIVRSVKGGGEAAGRKGRRRVTEDLRLDVGGFYRLAAEHVRWQSRRLRLGDEVRITIAEAVLASKPARRERADPNLVAKAEAKYLENAAKRLGWKIVKPGRLQAKQAYARPSGRHTVET